MAGPRNDYAEAETPFRALNTFQIGLVNAFNQDGIVFYLIDCIRSLTPAWDSRYAAEWTQYQQYELSRRYFPR